MIVALYEDDGDDDDDKDHDDDDDDDVDDDYLRCTAAAGAQVLEARVQWSSVGGAMFALKTPNNENNFNFGPIEIT